MKIFTKNSLTVTVVVLLVISLAGLVNVFAATTPSLGAAASYGVLSSSFINTSASTTITGDVGFTTGPAVAPLGAHTYYGSGFPYSTAGTDQGSALATGLANQGCTYEFPAGDINLTTDVQGHPGSVGTYPPGVYCVTGAMAVSATLTLDGAGTYIFRSTGALNTTASSIVTTANASACDIFWTPGALATMGATSTFLGTVVDDSGITIGDSATWSGRALAFGGTVTMSGDAASITVPSACSAGATPLPTSRQPGTINVVKNVINDNGRTKIVADFPLFVNGTSVVSGVTNTFPAPAAAYTVTETGDTNYTRTFSGDCDANGQLNLNPGDNKFCIVTNNDIGAPIVVPPVPPLIDVLKVPSPLALPAGPGLVTYNYTVRNIGTVSMSDVTMVGDSCSPINLISGDTNGDNKLDMSETWRYTCSTTLSATHTNIVTATGWANGISTVDVASATVVVGAPIVPPLIHLVKRPSVFTLPAGGGAVTYTYVVSNPGTASLSNVNISSDKCTGLPNRVLGHPGDINKNNLLESGEEWLFTCLTNITQTTINTGTASGEANGLTARDLAVATVVVADVVTKLPKTGIAPDGKSMPWNIIISVSVLFLISLSLTLVSRKVNN